MHLYQALYRKYRPHHFKDVVGQDAIVKTLQNALKTNKMSHAYLFAGPRGTGKTTMAKIFARTINCLTPQDGESCDRCKNCLESTMKECVDIIEIDAASNNGVDEIRELKNNINLVPSSLKYKIYIIDEVHMLSIGAFNALLKTLEEPPEHVIFILATTDVHKVPITILSRCQCFYFKKVGIEDAKRKLNEIATKEGISIDDTVLSEIAMICDGGMRDAIGNLDKLNSYSNGQITIDDFQELNGILNNQVISEFIQNILDKNTKSILRYIQTFDKSGKDFVQIVNQMIRFLRNQLLDYYLKGINLMYDEQDMIDLIRILNEIGLKLKNSENTRVLLEVELIDFMQKRNQIISREIISKEERLKKEENQIQPFPKVKQVEESKELISSVTLKPNILIKSESVADCSQKLIEIRINNTFAKASKEKLLAIKNRWSLLNEYIFDQRVGYLVCELLDGTLRATSDENTIISYEYESMLEKAKQHYLELKEQFNKILDVSTNLVFITDTQWNQLKQEFISKKEKNIPYIYQEESTINVVSAEVKEELPHNNDTNIDLSDSYQTAVAIFGDIVEME